MPIVNGRLKFSRAVQTMQWTTREDENMIDLRDHHKLSWANVAAFMPQRSEGALRCRYSRLKQQGFEDPPRSGQNWTAEEQAGLMNSYGAFNNGRTVAANNAKKMQLNRLEMRELLKDF
jgi:hypothetical protein